ncbi:MAG: FMN-binding protein, partial [Clostridia bacterium]|nr:FMN-binding protein [Clostridia bacterium]
MGDIMKLALRLFIFAFVAAVLLAITNEVTKGPIEAQKLAAKMDALNKVLPGCEYEQIEYEGLAEGSVLDEIFVGRNASGEIEGYALTANPQGYGGPIPITIGVSTGGYVTQVYVGSLQETAGLGSKVGEADFMDQFIAIAADPDTLRDDVDTISGATVSSSAFVNAVNEMLVYSKETLAIAPNKGDKDAILAAAAAASGEPDEPVVTTNTYDVTGFAPFKVEIVVDDAGKIVSVTVPEHGETEGFGADLIADTAVFDALVGQDIATAQIDVRAGVTLTSNAINDALKQAAAPAEGGAQVYDVTGFAPFKVAIEVDADGKIVSVSVPENDETPGFGADLIADTAVFDALVGQDIATAQIDVKAGVTLTSNAINDALRQAAAGANGAEAAVPGDPYTVKGMNKFTLYIEAEDGKIVSVSAPEHSETPGFGADLLTDEALAALAGQELATAQIDVKAGVTLTSEAINSALRQAA